VVLLLSKAPMSLEAEREGGIASEKEGALDWFYNGGLSFLKLCLW
jgi:hypothetical protein